MPLNEPQTYMYVGQMLVSNITITISLMVSNLNLLFAINFLQNKDDEHRAYVKY